MDCAINSIETKPIVSFFISRPRVSISGLIYYPRVYNLKNREEIVLSKKVKEMSEDEKSLRRLEEQLGELGRKRRRIENRIKENKKRIAIKNGEVVERLKDLKCERHPNAKFVRTHKIGSGLGNDSSWYVCEECIKERDAGKIKPHQISTAYSCPHCGFVKGQYESRNYESSPESWAALAGRKGMHFYCRVCGSMIGYDYWMVS